MNMYDKHATTITNQIDILFQRGLDINNSDEKVIQAIENVGYFKLKGYCLPFYESTDKFKSGVSFKNIYESYKLDQKFHSLLFSLINRTEAQFKARFGNFIALEYGPLGYLNYENFFKNSSYKEKWIESFNECEQKAMQRKELYVKHYKNDYDNTFPIWVIVEMLTLGDVSKFYMDMNTTDQKRFSRCYYKTTNKRLENWLHFLTLVRNCCAHNSRSFGKEFSTGPKFYDFPNLKEGNIFTAFLLLKKMCFSKNFYTQLVTKAGTYIKKCEYTYKKEFGFPEDWEKYLL